MGRRKPPPPTTLIAIARLLTDPARCAVDRGRGGGTALAARIACRSMGCTARMPSPIFAMRARCGPGCSRGEPLPIYYWPAGYPLLVALVLPLFGGASAAGQAVSIASIAVAAACTFLLCRELLPDARAAGSRPGWLGWRWRCRRCAARQPGDHVRSPALACCAAAIWAVARYTRTRRGRWLAAAAVALGWRDHALGVRDWRCLKRPDICC